MLTTLHAAGHKHMSNPTHHTTLFTLLDTHDTTHPIRTLALTSNKRAKASPCAGQVIGHALHVLVACLCPPPSLHPLLALHSRATAEAGHPSASATATAPTQGTSTAGPAEALGVNSVAGAGAGAGEHGTAAQQQPPPAAPRLAGALLGAYSYARQCVRAGHGIRTLMQLLQPRPATGMRSSDCHTTFIPRVVT